MKNNGKNNFYRTLNLKKEEKSALKFYTELKKEMEKETKDEEEK